MNSRLSFSYIELSGRLLQLWIERRVTVKKKQQQKQQQTKQTKKLIYDRNIDPLF